MDTVLDIVFKISIIILLVLLIISIIMTPFKLYLDRKIKLNKKLILSELSARVGEHTIISSNNLFKRDKIRKEGNLLIFAKSDLLIIEFKDSKIFSIKKLVSTEQL